MRVYNLVVAVAIVVVIIGCTETTNSPSQSQHFRLVPHGPLNPNNPYDSVGIGHNEVLLFGDTYVRETDTTLELLWQSYQAAMGAYCDSVGIVGAEKAYAIAFEDTLLFHEDDFDANWLADFNRPGYSDKELEYINRFGRALQVVDDSIGLVDSTLAIESDILSDPSISLEDDELIYIMIAIGKHSPYTKTWWLHELIEVTVAADVAAANLCAEGADKAGYDKEKKIRFIKFVAGIRSSAAGKNYDATHEHI